MKTAFWKLVIRLYTIKDARVENMCKGFALPAIVRPTRRTRMGTGNLNSDVKLKDARLEKKSKGFAINATETSPPKITREVGIVHEKTHIVRRGRGRGRRRV